MRMKATSASLCLLFFVATFVPSEERLTESQQQDDPEPDDTQPLIGRPDGHEPYDKPLIGRPDGHELHSKKDDSSDSSDSSDEDSEAEQERPAGEERLVRCKRPMCAMYCENGFKNGEDGCPICECVEDSEDSDRPLIGRPDGHEVRDGPLIGRPDGHEVGTNPACAGRPMCLMYCELGFKRDDDGCPICDCLEDPCQGANCGAGLQCKPLPCEDLHACTKLSHICVEPSGRRPSAATRSRPRCRGPEPMCANYCPGGYKYRPDGCMTCDCADEPQPQPDNCGDSEPCEDGLVCRNRTVKGVTKQMCTVKTLCEMERERKLVLGSSPVSCEADGSFNPLQCTASRTRCMCVDGLGREVPHTRTPVYIEGHKPDCVRNVTVSMHIHMLMVVEHHIDVTRLDSLHSLIVDHVSSWLLIEPHYVTIVKTAAQKSGGGKVVEDDEVSMVAVEVVVVHDGVTDLPSAGEHMRRRMQQGRCHIPVDGGGSLKPDPHSLSLHHKFAKYAPTTTMHYFVHPERKEHHHMHRATLIPLLAAIGTFILLMTILTVCIAYARSKRARLAAQFQHQKLESPTVSEKNLLGNDYVAEPVAVATEDVVKEKQPIA